MVLGPILKLINGPTVANALADPASELNQLVNREPDNGKVIGEVFLRFLGREPTGQELKLGIEALAAAAADGNQAAQALAAYEKTLPEKQAAWEAAIGQPVVWTTLVPTETKSAAGATFAVQDDGAIVVSGKLAKDVYTIIVPTDVAPITGLKLEALADPSLGSGGPGRAPNGNFVLSELKLMLAPKADAAKSEAVALQGGSADFSQANYAASAAIDGNDATGWAVHPETGKSHAAIFETKAPAGAAGGSILTLTLSQQYQDGKHCLGKFRLSVTDSPRPAAESNLPAPVAAALAVPAGRRTLEQAAAVASHYRTLDGELARLTAEVAKAAEQAKNARAIGVQDLAWALINSPAFLFNR
jgi:hypothetical protein